MAVNLHPHQRKAVEEMHNGCVLLGDVGVGKSITSLAYFFEKVCGGDINGDWGDVKTPMDVYVITTAKKRNKRDWNQEAYPFGISEDPEASRGGIKLTVDSWNNIGKYRDVKDAFFILDEQKVVGSGAWTKAFTHIAKHNQWILLSATPGDTWLDYIPIFVANGFYKNRTQFKREHVVYRPFSKYPVVDHYISVNKLVKHKNAVLVDMPYERHTKRHGKIVKVDYDKDAFEKVVKKRWHVYEDRPLRDPSELFSVMRKVVNSDESRISMVNDLLQRHPKLIVFYNHDPELQMLRELGETLTDSQRMEASTCSPSTSSEKPIGTWTLDTGMGEMWVPNETSPAFDCQKCREMRCDPVKHSTPSSEGLLEKSTTSTTTPSLSRTKKFTDESLQLPSTSFAVAEWNGHKHQEIPKTDSWLYLVQYTAGAEGWNCIETDATVFFSLTYSYKQFYQSHGRIDRLNTPYTDLYYYYLKSDAQIDRLVWGSLTNKENFNERDYLKEF